MRYIYHLFMLTVFAILSGLSIYCLYLEETVNAIFTLQKVKEIEKSDTKWLFANSQYMKHGGHLRYNTSQNQSQCINCTSNDHTHNNLGSINHTKSQPRKRRIWVSMGLCFSKNTEMYGKKYYPYALVTPLAILLWYHFFPEIRLLIYLIYDKHELEDRRRLYEEQLKQTNVEIRWVREDDMNCVTKSQVIRMWAFQDPMVRDDDIIVTVDVNLFVVTPKILDPIHENPDLKVWVYQWDRAAFVESGIGETFNQNLICAEAKVWRQIVEPGEEALLNQKWLTGRIEEIGLARSKSNDQWYYYQWVTTYGILKNRLCTVPESSGLWKVPGLVDRKIYFPELNDSKTCLAWKKSL